MKLLNKVATLVEKQVGGLITKIAYPITRSLGLKLVFVEGSPGDYWLTTHKGARLIQLVDFGNNKVNLVVPKVPGLPDELKPDIYTRKCYIGTDEAGDVVDVYSIIIKHQNVDLVVKWLLRVDSKLFRKLADIMAPSQRFNKFVDDLFKEAKKVGFYVDTSKGVIKHEQKTLLQALPSYPDLSVCKPSGTYESITFVDPKNSAPVPVCTNNFGLSKPGCRISFRDFARNVFSAKKLIRYLKEIVDEGLI